MKARLVPTSLLLVLSTVSFAEEQPVPLKDAPGRDVVQNNCATCHSLDYPRTNSVFMDRKAWESEVNKMIATYGAPIAPEDAKAIVEYLVTNYGVGA